MKKLFLYFSFSIIISGLSAQTSFSTEIATAKTSYAASKLEETHFALQQSLSELDIIIGKEILKMVPEKMDTVSVNKKNDQVTSNMGMVGAIISRTYGNSEKVKFELMSNSPLVNALSAILNTPLLGGMMRDENSKTIKVQGYKGRLERQSGNVENEYNYTLQLPFSNALLTFTVKNSNETEITKLANTLPLQQIAKLVQ